MPRINQSVETMVMNDKGEMVSKRANTVMSWGDEPSYIKLYLQDIMYLSDMPKKYVAVTEALLKRIAYAGDEDGLCVSLLPRTKKAICDELGWKTVASLDNALQKLLAGKILYRVDRGMYRFNPYLFGKVTGRISADFASISTMTKSGGAHLRPMWSTKRIQMDRCIWT